MFLLDVETMGEPSKHMEMRTSELKEEKWYIKKSGD